MMLRNSGIEITADEAQAKHLRVTASEDTLR